MARLVIKTPGFPTETNVFLPEILNVSWFNSIV
jgi:hypothetical protein